ncbi:endothelin-converting enzyme homolog [Coccinella septempunctata]|uniref:endothelin-converting enzyme homolog n=1 Tax=Coccinella septempunctata TaxID=41139 RepID=UPI001D0983EA|nr:endothelin-converting enzyme homolog [Coccinella septempunctata]
MTKETYEVSSPLNGGPPRRRSDNSFWLCACTMLVVFLICVIILMFSFKWCELGLFRKSEESSFEMLERIQYTTETTKILEFGIIKNISTARPEISSSSKRAEISVNSSTAKPPGTTTSKKYVASFLTYLKYLKSLQTPNKPIANSREKTMKDSTEETTSGKIDGSIENSYMEITSTQESNEVDSISGVENSVGSTAQEGVNSTKKIEFQRYEEKGTLASNGTTMPRNQSDEVGEDFSLTTIGVTQDLQTQTMTNTVSKNSTLSSADISVDSLSKLNELLAKDKDVCNSTKCDLTAARIILSMDNSKQPCENFYEFACGGILGIKREELDIFSPKMLNSEDNPEFLNKFNTFYRSCVKHEDRFNYQLRIKRAKNLLHSIGSFHFDGQTNKTYNITEFVANLILFKAMPLFEVEIDIDPDDSKYILKLMMPDQTSLNFEHWSSLAESKRKCLRETKENAVGSPLNMTILYRYFRNCQMNYSDFLDSIDTAVLELGFFSHLSEKAIFKQIRDIRVFIEFEIFSLFEEIAPPPNLQEMVVRRQYENIKLKQLENEFPLIEWERLFRIISNENITSETVIQMYNRQYFEDVFRGLSSLDRGMLNNAFLAILANSLFENTVLPSHKHSRTDYCDERSEELMPDIINYLYKKIIPPEELKEHNKYIEELYNDLASSFNKSLENLDWLDDASKMSIRKKLDSIQLAMFRNDDVDSEIVYLEDGYKDLVLKDSDYQYNFFNLMEFRRKRLFSLQGQKVTSENMYRYFVDATKEEPVFFYANDIVCIPYGLAKRATRDLPRYIVLAQVGFPLAKIIGHAFDPVGIQYRAQLSETANLSYLNFAEQTRDMIVLSNPIKFGGQEFSFSLNNALSESERVAENTALRLLTDLFETFKNDSLLPWISYKFKKEKIFFLTMTQEFCRDMDFTEFMIEAYESHILPPQFRIENILGNSEEFLKQFNCRPGSAMTRFEDRLQFPHLIALSKEDLDYMN